MHGSHVMLSGLQEASSYPLLLVAGLGVRHLSRKGKGVMLDGIDEAVIERAKQENTEFRHLLEQHETYEKQLASYNDLRFLTNEQEVERKHLQKLKLQGKDRMISILRQFQTS